MEQGKYIESDKGTPQGGLISPILANVYLHYVLDLWFEKEVTKKFNGESYMVRYADDFVCCFQYKKEAELFYELLKRRMGHFGLTLEENKTRLIYFGRFAEENLAKVNKKPETFDFLGFTHYGSKSRNGNFRVKHRTAGKKFRKKCKQMNKTIRDMRFEKKKYILLENDLPDNY